MDEEYLGYGSSTQFGGVQEYRCRVRETCASTVLVPGDRSADRRVRRSGRCSGGETFEPGTDAVLAARTSPLTTLEQALVKVLPRWPEAWQAVMDYARKAAGPFPGSGESR